MHEVYSHLQADDERSLAEGSSPVRRREDRKRLLTRALVRSLKLCLCHVALYPRVHVAFSPSQVLSYPVGGESPFPPLVAYGPLWDSEYRGYVARREHAVGAA
jgi:hypothetical protein